MKIWCEKCGGSGGKEYDWENGEVVKCCPVCTGHGYTVHNKLVSRKLACVFDYCYKLARIVSPYTAKQEYGLKHDGAVSDFLSDLAVAALNGDELDLDDDLYGEVYQRLVDACELGKDDFCELG